MSGISSTPPGRLRGDRPNGRVALGDGLRRSPILRRIHQKTLEVLLGASAIRTYSDGAVLQPEDAGADRLMFVTAGAVKVHLGTILGFERILQVAAPGTVLNLAAVVAGTSRAPALTSLTAVDVLAVPADTVRHTLSRRADLGIAIAEELAAELASRDRDDTALSDLDASGRVAYRLSELARTWGTETPTGHVIDLPITQEELGAWARVSRESTAKALHSLRNQGIVSTGRRLLVIHSLEELDHRAGIHDLDLTDLASVIA